MLYHGAIIQISKEQRCLNAFDVQAITVVVLFIKKGVSPPEVFNELQS